MASKMWMVRAGRGAYAIEDFKEKGVVAVGWERLDDCSNVSDKAKFVEMVKTAWPEMNKRQAIMSGSQIYRFVNELALDDRIITYDPSTRVYYVGNIISDYQFDPKLIETFRHIRKVHWEGEVDRDKLKVSTRNSLGAISTLFLIPEDAAEDIENILAGREVPEEEVEDTEEEELLKETQERSREFIKDRINKLDWEEMQELVAGLLRAMGYKTRVSPLGPDKGKDIIASPDGLGFESPRIFVEVKHRSNPTGAQEIRSFIGGRHAQDKGLYVSTGGFSKDARYEGERAAIPLTMMDLDDLVGVVVEYYERMDMEARALLPLVKIFWPT